MELHHTTASPPPTRSGELADPRLVARMQQLAQGVGWLMLACGVVVLAGWALGLDALTRLLGPTTMKPVTAVTFMLGGSALLVCAQARLAGYWCALPSGLVGLIGVLTLAQYVAGVDLGIDHLFPDPEAVRLGRMPGRMSQLTAVGFVMLGVLGLMVRFRRAELAAQGLAVLLLAAGALALALAGYGYQPGMLFEPVAVPTAALLMAGAWGG